MIRNSTPGRTLTFVQQGFGTSPGNNYAGMFQFAGVFPTDSPVCKLVEQGYGPTPPTASALHWGPVEGCAYVYLNSPVGPDGSGSVALGAGEVKTLGSFGSVGDIQTYGNEAASNLRGGSGPMIVAHIPDGDYDTVLAALSAPPKVVLAISDGSLGQSAVPCQVIATSDGSPGC